MVPFYKDKGDQYDRTSFGGTSLMSIAGKLYGTVNRVIVSREGVISRRVFGIWKGYMDQYML